MSKKTPIPAPMKQFIFLAATACAFQYPNKYSFIPQKNKKFYVFPELILTFYSIYDILNINIKKFLGRRIYLPPQLLSNVTDAFALQGLMRLFLFLQAYIACSQLKGVQISGILPDYNGQPAGSQYVAASERRCMCTPVLFFS